MSLTFPEPKLPLASPTLFLYGPPATGKSTCAHNLSAAIGKPAMDLDTLIERRIGMTIPEYVQTAGPEAFRDAETATLKALCESRPDGIVALGGGALLRPQNRAMAEACGPVVCIRTPVEALVRRVERKKGSRPWSKDGDQLRKLLKEREAHYGSFTLQLNLEAEMTPQEVWPKVLALFGRYIVGGMGEPYNVLIAPHAVRALPNVLAKLTPKPIHLLLVGDSNTMPLCGPAVKAALGRDVPTFTIPAGEEHKTLATVASIWQAMCEAGLERGDLAIALGGGVTGDLTGFAASAWMRGIRWLNLPTTLLSMVDAGIGGKTGADLPAGKNLIGAFHPPCAVLADTAFLATLPDRETRCGLAETYKHAVIADPGLADMLRRFAECRGDLDYLTALVNRSAAVKIRTIQEDPFEKTGKRAALNLGHTLGHAIEAASGFALAHGEAVAIGTVAAARLSERLGLTREPIADNIVHDLEALGLPTEIPAGLDEAAILFSLSHDKKKADGRVRFALPRRIGEVQTGCIVPEDTIHELLDQTQA